MSAPDDIDHGPFLEQLLLLDVEVRPDGTGPVDIGAVHGESVTHRRAENPQQLVDVLEQLAASRPRALLGHNVILHDLPHLRKRAPAARLLALPAVDTLFLSPLAFPQNPYHALVKGYKLSKSAVNDPVADARLAAAVFASCQDALREADAARPGTLGFYRWLFARATAHGALADGGGIADALAAMGGTVLDGDGVSAAFREIAHGRTCDTAAVELTRDLGTDTTGHLPLALAYTAAWLPVAGSNSVIPQWVRREIPLVTTLVHRLRESPCGDAACDFCRTHHDPTVQLQHFFGFDAFRDRPAAPDGSSLQLRIVEHALRGGSCLAVLPTGGGKSLCFQLPALVRNRLRGSLTIVISPLQALMRDQVGNLARRTRTRAAALYGLLTPLERGRVLREIAAGDVTILYIAPEQLRNRSFRGAVAQREIGGWVFDEAHCLSKWGHDFRPDYLYACRAIREIAAEQGAPIPPIAALTATAKRDVAAEIRAHFRDELQVELVEFAGGVQRDNLAFTVEAAVGGRKRQRVRELCADLVASPAGSAIVYHATRHATETMAALLQQDGLPAAHFHGGMSPPDKKATMDRFLEGDIRVICATNAFGMGVDKPDVRLVVHAEIPGTLESYLQEAGRAGRDQRPSRCVLLFDEKDVEDQFRLLAAGEIRHPDMVQILRGLRYCGRRAGRRDGEDFQLTSGELLREDAVDTSFDAEDRDADTKVRTAVSWLERAHFVERNLNHTRVFTGKPALHTQAEAEARMNELDVRGLRLRMWTEIYRVLLNADPDEGLTVDDLAGLPSFREWHDGLPPERRAAERVSRNVLDELHAMTTHGLLTCGVQLTAFVHTGGPKPSLRVLEHAGRIEQAVLAILPEHAPDAGDDTWQVLSLRRLNEALLQREVETNVESLRTVLLSLARDGRGEDVHLTLRPLDRDRYRVRLQGTFQQLRERAELRGRVAHTCLRALLDRTGGNGNGRTDQLVEFAIEDLVRAVSSDLTLRAQPGTDALEPIERVLLFLHDQGCIILQKGLAVFRAAMTLRLEPEAHSRRYTKVHYAELRAHYDERTVQVHVMDRYAHLGLLPNGAAAELIEDYFTAPRDRFVTRHFGDRRDELARPIGPAAYRKIVDDLQHDVQQAIVTAPPDENQLVLAGPGSGKTRVIVHRCAYLLRVLRVPRSAVLVLCFNRSTVLELRRRLRQLLGGSLAGLQIHTYDSLALRIAGRSLIGAVQHEEARGEDVFARIREEACELLEGKRTTVDLDGDELRDRLLTGYRHVLVDEYQDIDATQYRLVSAIAGRTREDKDARVAITAVGDDDQNIYHWRGARVEFLRRFVEDYGAEPYQLVENFRSTGNIVAVANRWIAANADRAKTEPIRVDRRRADAPDAAGEPVHVLRVAGTDAQVTVVGDELAALRGSTTGRAWNEVAVLAREWGLLMPLRLRCRELGIPVRWSKDESVRPWQVRETHRLLAHLGTGEELDARRLRAFVQGIAEECGESVWTDYLRRIVRLWIEDSGTSAMPACAVREFLWSVMREDRQLAMAAHGVFLGTVHQAKGLEFDRVVLLDGGWEPRPDETADELRRVFYVGMTRARRKLTVLTFAGRSRSFARTMHGPEVAVRDLTAVVAEAPAGEAPRQIAQIDLGDLFLDYAGRRPESDPVHAALARLRIGSLLDLEPRGERAVLVDPSGVVVAALSDSGSRTWATREVIEVRVLAMVQRSREQCGSDDFRSRCRVERWELPVVDVVWRDVVS